MAKSAKCHVFALLPFRTPVPKSPRALREVRLPSLGVLQPGGSQAHQQVRKTGRHAKTPLGNTIGASLGKLYQDYPRLQRKRGRSKPMLFSRGMQDATGYPSLMFKSLMLLDISLKVA